MRINRIGLLLPVATGAVIMQIAGCNSMPVKQTSEVTLRLAPLAITSILPAGHASKYYHAGDVALSFMIDTSGVPRDIMVAYSHPRGLYEREAIGALRKTHFAPPSSPYVGYYTYHIMLPLPPAANKVEPNAAAKTVLAAKPVYPFAARIQCTTGAVKMAFTINKLGRPTDIRILGGEHAKAFAGAALAALKSSYFLPEYVDGHATDSEARYTYRFATSKTKTAAGSEVEPLQRVAPRYPEEAAQNDIEGNVTFDFTVDSQGSATNIEVVSGSSTFVPAARYALIQSRFAPDCVDGKPVPIHHARYTYSFWFVPMIGPVQAISTGVPIDH